MVHTLVAVPLHRDRVAALAGHRDFGVFQIGAAVGFKVTAGTGELIPCQVVQLNLSAAAAGHAGAGFPQEPAKHIQSNSLTVRRAMTFLNNQQDPVDDLKTKAAHRVIPIPDKLRAILLDTPHLSRYIVPASNGGDMTRSAFTRMWNSHVVSLVPFPLHPHMLRHTYATTLYRARVDLRTAQKLMGHSSIQVTADIYTHLEQEDSLHVADKLNEYLSGKSENSVKSSQKVVKLAI